MARWHLIAWLVAVSGGVAVGCHPSQAPASPVVEDSQPVVAAAPTPAAPSAADQGDSRSSCEDALASIERVHGAKLEEALARGIFEHFEPLTWAELGDSCTKWSPWTRKCASLAQTTEQMLRCSPELEPYPRSGYGGVARSAREEFYSCVSAATTRAALERCEAAYLAD